MSSSTPRSAGRESIPLERCESTPAAEARDLQSRSREEAAPRHFEPRARGGGPDGAKAGRFDLDRAESSFAALHVQSVSTIEHRRKKQSLEDVLALLHGARHLGPWSTPWEGEEPSSDRPAHGALTPRRLALVVLAGVLLGLGTLLVRAGQQRQEERKRTTLTAQLREFLLHGELAQAGKRVSSLCDTPSRCAELSPETRALVARAQATLYRWHDGDPARLTAIEALTVPADSVDLAVKNALLKSADKWSAEIHGLEALAQKDATGCDALYLVALARARVGDLPGAVKAFRAANERGSAHLPYLALQVQALDELGLPVSAQRVAKRMAFISKKSPWTAWALALAGADSSSEPSSAASEPPVLRILKALAQGIPAEGIAPGPEILLDHVDRLIRRGDLSGARSLLGDPRMPAASGLAARLAWGEGGLQAAASMTVPDGEADPLARLLLVQRRRRLNDLDGAKSTLDALERDWGGAWPIASERIGLWLSDSRERPSTRSRKALEALVPAESRSPVAAQRWLLLARLEARVGTPAGARRLAQRSLEADPENREARALLERLERQSQRVPRSRKLGRR
jgi:hypothetical protein